MVGTVMLTGGGTAGHINPGLAVVGEIRRLRPSASFVWVGTRDRLEARLVPQAGIPLETISVAFLKGRGIVGKLLALLLLPRALWQSLRLLRRHRPDVVVGVGGFASGPVGLVAALLRRPTAILEQNARPGLTNRILGRFVKRVYVSFDETVAQSHFAKRKVRAFGNPIRTSLLDAASGEAGVDQAAADETGVAANGEAAGGEVAGGRAASADAASGDAAGPEERPARVLVIGGSQGARSLNLDLPRVLARVAERGVELEVRHSAGRGRVEEVEQAYSRADGALAASQVIVHDYIDDMAGAYRWADFVICRSGASTVAELTALGKAALYVPFPAAADNHQERNARAVVDQGGGLLALDRELADDAPVDALAELLADSPRLLEMGRAARQLGRPDAAQRIARDILELVEGGEA